MEKSNYSLFFETVLSKTFISLIKDKKIIETKTNVLDFNTDNTYVQDIKDLCEKNLISSCNISEIYIVNGPGYFTGIRAGIAITKAFMIGLKINVNIIDSFSFINSCISYKEDKVIIISASKNDLYTGYFKKNVLIKSEIIETSEIINYKKNNKIYTDNQILSEKYEINLVNLYPNLKSSYKQVDVISDIIPNYIRQESDMFLTKK